MAGCNPTLSASHRNHLGRDDCARSKRWFCLAIEFNLDSLRIDPSSPPGRSSPNDLHKKLSLLRLHRNVSWLALGQLVGKPDRIPRRKT